jgi:hypothetical protein
LREALDRLCRARPSPGVILGLAIGVGAAGCADLALDRNSESLQSPAALFEVTTVPNGQLADGGFEMSVNQGTQFNDNALHIGCGDVDGGPYYDEEAQAPRHGPHAHLTIVVDGKTSGRPRLVQQAAIGEGQLINADAYRILVEKVMPAGADRAWVVLRIWHPHT